MLSDFVEEKQLNEAKKSGKPSRQSITAIKKLMECDWSEEHIRPLVAECFQQLVECDDPMTTEFLSKLSESAKTIGEGTVYNYTTRRQAIDHLPRKPHQGPK